MEEPERATLSKFMLNFVEASKGSELPNFSLAKKLIREI
jgi:hypothetical protein